MPTLDLQSLAVGVFAKGIPCESEATGAVAIPDDPWEFLKLCHTYDELAKQRGEEPLRPFPDRPYLQVITRQWQAHQYLSIEKSRQIMVTWLMAGLHLWWVLRSPGQRVAWFCMKRPVAVRHLEGRVLRMYLSLPRTLVKPVADMVNGEFLVFHDGRDALPTSRITPMAAETDAAEDASKQMRSETWSRWFLDEIAFCRNAEDTLFSLLPGGGGGATVSTPNGHSFFWRLGHVEGLEGEVETSVTKEPLAKGIEGWNLNGFRHLGVHYTADPAKDPATPEGKAWYESPTQVAARANTRKWRREMELDSTIPAGHPVYADTERIVVAPQVYRPRLKLIRGWDFGFNNPVCIFLQVCPLEEDGKTVGHTVHCLKEVHVPHKLIREFAQDHVLPVTTKGSGRCLFPDPSATIDFGDPAGHQRSDKSPLSSIQVLAALGINVRTSHAEVDTRIDLLQEIISNGQLEIDPAGCPGLLNDLRGGYYRDEHGKPVKDGIHDHRPDGLGYAIFNLFGLRREGSEGKPRVSQPKVIPATWRQQQVDRVRRGPIETEEPSRPKPAIHTARVFQPAPYGVQKVGQEGARRL